MPRARPVPDPEPTDREAVLRAHGPMVWSLCRRLCPEPEDAYQEVWEKVFHGLPSFDPDGDGTLRGWIATITHRHLVDRHRRREARGVVVELGELPSVDPAVDERLAKRQGLARLDAALGRLPEAHRRVVVLHHVQGVALERLAETEGVALGTIKSRLHRGRARLAALLGGET